MIGVTRYVAMCHPFQVAGVISMKFTVNGLLLLVFIVFASVFPIRFMWDYNNTSIMTVNGQNYEAHGIGPPYPSSVSYGVILWNVLLPLVRYFIPLVILHL